MYFYILQNVRCISLCVCAYGENLKIFFFGPGKGNEEKQGVWRSVLSLIQSLIIKETGLWKCVSL